MVPFAETLTGRLSAAAEGYNVYSFAMSNSPLSQYLVWARHARKHYNIQGMVFVIIDNDFDQSFRKYRNSNFSLQYYYQFTEEESGQLHPRLPKEHIPSPTIKRALCKLDIYSYLYFNCNWGRSMSRIKKLVDNRSAKDSAERLEDSKRAADAFLRLVSEYSSLPRSKILFVVDSGYAARFDLYYGVKKRYNYINISDLTLLNRHAKRVLK